MSATTYNFVVDCTDNELDDYLDKINIEEPSELVEKTDLGWCLQSYLILKKKTNLDLICSNHLKKGAVNIIHSAQLVKFKGISSHFIVCIQADFSRRRWAHYHIVQNRNQLKKDTSYVTFWLQPGLIERHPDRKGVKRVAYVGQTWGNLAGTLETWSKSLQEHNIEFVTIPKEAWHNLSSIDILIGIRSFDRRPHNRKPPSKLINAWHAQIPFIGGYDSAFTQVGIPNEDYLRVHNECEAVKAILRLRDDEKLYSKLVENGKRKSKKYSTETIAKAWEEILLGPVLQRYEKWKLRPDYEKFLFNTRQNVAILKFDTKQLIKSFFKDVISVIPSANSKSR